MIKRRLMKALFLTLLCLFSSIGVAYAFFTAREVIEDNVLATGKLDITINDGGVASYMVEDTQPGEWKLVTEDLVIKNTGSLSVQYRLLIDPADEAESELMDYVQTRVGIWNIQEGKWEDVYEGMLRGFAFESTTSLNPEDLVRYRMEVQLDQALANSWQMQSVNFTIAVEATQTNNLDWQGL